MVIFSTCKAFPTLVLGSGSALGGCSLPLGCVEQGTVKHITRVTQLGDKCPQMGGTGAWRWAGAGEEAQWRQCGYSKSSFMN